MASHPVPSATRLLAVGLLVCCASSSCRGIEVAASEAAPLPASALWRFAADTAVEPPELDAALRAAIERELEAHQWTRSRDFEAEYSVYYDARVTTERREQDIDFSFYAAEEVEYGTLTIELRAVGTGIGAWRGSATSELRLSAVLVAPFDAELTPTGDEREWKVDEKVGLMFERFPRRSAVAGPDADDRPVPRRRDTR